MTALAVSWGDRLRRAERRRLLLLPLVLAVSLAILSLPLAGPARGVTRTWSGGGVSDNWNDAGNWVGGFVPGVNDLATFDGTSSDPANINVNISVGGIAITAAYTGTISQVGASTVTVGGQAFNQAAGTFVGGTGAISVGSAFTVSGGSFTSTSATLSISGNYTHTAGGTFNAGGGTVALTGGSTTIDVAGSETFNNLSHVAGTKTISAGDTLVVNGSTALIAGALNGATGSLAAQGAISVAAGYTGGSASLRVNGSGAQTLTSSLTAVAGSLPALVIDKPSGTLTLATTAGAVIRTSNNWTYTAGTLDPGTTTVVFAGTQTITGSHSLADVQFSGNVTHTVAAGTTLTVTGALTLTDGSIATGTVAAQGAISQASTFDGGSGILRVNGAGAQTLTGSATTALGTLPQLVIDKPSGTLTLATTAGAVIRTSNNWTYTAGTLDPGTTTVVFAGTQTITGSHSLADVQFSGNVTHTVAAGTTLTVTGALTLTDGSIATGTVAAQGAISQASTFDGGSGILRVNGAGAQTLTGSATTALGTLPQLVIDKPSGTLTLATTAGAVIRTSNNWTYTAGTLDPGTTTVVFAGGTISGSHGLYSVEFRATTSLAAGTTLTASGSTALIAGALNGATGSLAAQGAISVAAGYTGGSASLRVNGSGAQTLTSSLTAVAGSLPALVIDKPSGTLTLATTAGAVIRTSNNWTYTAGTLDPGTTTVVFAGGTISGSHGLYSVEFRATTSLAAGTTLTASGSTALIAGALNGATGSLAAQGAISVAAGYTGGSASLRVNGSGAQTLTSSLTAVAGSLPALVIDKPSGTLTLATTAGAVIRTSNNWTYTAGTLDPGTTTVVFAGGTISGSHGLYSVEFRATTSLAAGTTLTASGSTALIAGALNGATGSLAAQGAISVAAGYTGGSASLRVNGSGAQTLTSSLTAVAGSLPALVIDKPSGTLTLATTAGAVIRTSNNWTYTAGTLDPGTTTVVFAGNATVAAAGMDFYDVLINGGTRTMASALSVLHDLTIAAGTLTTSVGSYAITVGRDLSVAGTLTANGSLISVAGNLSKTGTFTAGTSTVLLDGTAGQSISGTAWTMRNLTIDDAAGVTMGTNVSVTGVLTLADGAFTVGANTLTIANPIAGVPTNLTADATSSLSVAGTASGIVIPSSVVQLLNLTVNDAAGVTLAGDLTVNGTLTLTSGPVFTGVDTLIMAPGSVVTRTNGRVAGYLRKTAPLGSPVALTFEIGDATRYAPVAVSFGTVSAVGALTASTTAGEHPDVAASGIDPAQDVNRYWTLTNGGIGFDDYNATFTFVAADRDAGTDPLAFIVAKDDAAIWSLPTVGTRTMTSTQAVAMTSFSDFVVGEPEADLVVTKDDGVATVTAGDGTTYTYAMTVTNEGPSDATGVVLTDTWPTPFDQSSITPSQGTCTAIGGGPDFACSLGTIAVGETATVLADFSVPANVPAGPQTNTAEVASDVADPDPSNDSASDTDTVEGEADLVLAKDDGVTNVTAGDGLTYTYTIDVTNEGPSDATGVVLTDTWPAGFSQGAFTASQGTCAAVGPGPDFQCDLGTIAADEMATVLVTYTVPGDLGSGPQTNSASVASDVNDPDPADAGASDTTSVTGVTPTATPDASQMPETGSLGRDAPDLVTSLLPPAVGLFLLGLTLLAVGLWGARRRRAPDRRDR